MGLKESLGNTIRNFARIFPGIAEYQDKESLRGQDKVVREHLSEALTRTGIRLDELKMRLIEAKKIKYLDRLEMLTKKVSKLADLIKHAPYGYSPVFAGNSIDEAKLKKIYDYDISLAEEIKKLDKQVMELVERTSISLNEAAFADLDRRLVRLEGLITGRKKYA